MNHFKPMILSEVIGKDFVSKAGSVDRKLSFDEVEQIRIEYKNGGVSQKKLADKYGIAQSTLFNIVSNKSYTK